MEPDDIAVAIDFGLRDAFDLVRAGSVINAEVDQPLMYLAVYRANSRIIVPEGEFIAFVSVGEHGRVLLSLTTRYEDLDGFRVPRELRYIVVSQAPDVAIAVDYLYDIAQRFHQTMQLTVNAAADLLQETLVQEEQDVFPGVPGAFFRQTEFAVSRLPRNGRIAVGPLAARIIDASFGLPEAERDRFDRAAAHYCIAVGHWREGEIPLAMMHLYIGVEAICEGVIRNIQRRHAVSEDDLITKYRVESEKYPRTALVNAIRRKVVFQDDDAAYRAARSASDGIEHGYADFEEVWTKSREAYIKTAKYLRETLLGMLNLDDATMTTLCGPRFGEVLREEPRYFETGVFEGDSLTSWKQHDFRILDTVPFLRSMTVDQERGTYEFSFDWHNKFNYSKRVVLDPNIAPEH